MRWYKFYFKSKDEWVNNLGLESDYWSEETMGILARSKEDAVKQFWSKISEKNRKYFKIESVEEGQFGENIMKLTREDVKKYGTEKEKKILKEKINKYEISYRAAKSWKKKSNYHEVKSCALCQHANHGYEGEIDCILLEKFAEWDSAVRQYGICDNFKKR